MKKNILEISNLTYTYRGNKIPTINDVSFSIKENTWTSVIGANGSGKSTLTRLINGLISPDDNQVSKIIIDGCKIDSSNIFDLREDIGIVFQNPDNQFVGATVNDDIAFGLENRCISRKEMLDIIPKVLHDVDMDSFGNSEPQLLSGGQKQRVAIAGIIAIQPKIIILDEATSMLDLEGKEKILKLLRKLKEKKNLTVLSITHDLDEISMADQVLVMDNGKIIGQDDPDKIFNNTAVMKKSNLELPLTIKLKNELSAKGLSLPNGIKSIEMLVDYLCR